jgi:L-asparagine transporter-like permease
MNNLLLTFGFLTWIPIVLSIYYVHANKNLVAGVFASGICIINLIAISVFDSIELWLLGMFLLSTIMFFTIVYLIFTKQTGNKEKEERTKIHGAIP